MGSIKEVFLRTYAKIAKKLNLSNRQDEAVRCFGSQSCSNCRAKNAKNS